MVRSTHTTRWLRHAMAVVVVGACGGNVAVDRTTSHDCHDKTLADVCSERACRTLDEEVDVFESLCDRGFDSFVKVLSHGCGITEVHTIGTFHRGPWFDSVSGELVGFVWVSDTKPECNGVLYGTTRDEGCESVATEPCSICGWNTCEWSTCTDEVTACAFGFPCAYLWKCAVETGCRGEECTNETVCPGFSMQYAPMALEALDALQTCLANVGCPDVCPLSLQF